jgi:hypothetical protein
MMTQDPETKAVSDFRFFPPVPLEHFGPCIPVAVWFWRGNDERKE